MHSAALLPFLAGLAAANPIAATTTDTPAALNPTPDALPLDFLANVVIPTYSTLEGASSQDIPYAIPTAIVAVADDVQETPLSVFPAVTTVAINAAGDGAAADAPTPTATVEKRGSTGVERRDACAAQATIASKYMIDLSSASAFRADGVIADTAKAATVPSGYQNNFVNLQGANSAYAYLGYTVVNTGYDVAYCAAQCDKKTGCLSFNIYFERDPTVDPGTGCEDPPAFANIKCSFWGSALDDRTATNTGQFRSSFEVAIAGSNAYTSSRIGATIPGWSAPLDLGNAAMNAPLWDAANTWTYMGYKLFQDGPFDVKLCAAACDAQTQYNVAHPPSTGYTPLCAGFGTYQLTVTDRNTGKASVVGQMCTMYTSAWGAEYATNTVAWNDAIMAKYTYSLSFFYSKPELQPVSDSNIAALKQDGGAFCSAYISYVPPVTSTTTTKTPMSTITSFSTITDTLTYTKTITSLTDGIGRRDDANATENAILVSYITASSDLVPPPTLATPTSTDITTPLTSSNATTLITKRGAPATPTAVANWPAYKISAACSNVATGTSTSTATSTAPTATTTAAGTTHTAKWVTSTTTVFTSAPTSVFIAQSSDTTYYQQAILTLPFNVAGPGMSNNQVSLDRAGWMCFQNPWHDDGTWDLLRLYWQGFSASDITIAAGKSHYIKAAIVGAAPSRAIVFEWNVGSKANPDGLYHFTQTIYEDKPGVVLVKFYEMFNDGLSGNPSSPGTVSPVGQVINDYTSQGRGKWLMTSPRNVKTGTLVTSSWSDNKVVVGTY